jgi:hypothetical protein
MELDEAFNVNENFYKKMLLFKKKTYLINFLLFKKNHIKLNLDDDSRLSIINYIYIYY